jgi:hypothetical protein
VINPANKRVHNSFILQLVTCDLFVFSETNVKFNNKKHGDPNDPRVRLKRDCVGLLAAFKLSDPCDHILIVANTHIYWQVNSQIFLLHSFHISLYPFLIFLLTVSSMYLNFLLMHIIL